MVPDRVLCILFVLIWCFGTRGGCEVCVSLRDNAVGQINGL
jgi:hypothetical protein